MAVDPDKYVRKLVSIPVDIWAQIEDYRFQNRFKTESAAIRDLLSRGLKSLEGGANSESTEKKPQARLKN